MIILENIVFILMAVLTKQPVYGQNLAELAEISKNLNRVLLSVEPTYVVMVTWNVMPTFCQTFLETLDIKKGQVTDYAIINTGLCTALNNQVTMSLSN